ncbi:F-box/LRR-repeat protein At5g02910-like [Eucalyptus grandis]|uniref:F-box/LRR-repeat protein At5g02910-like n=1 Tax=Eucalyptus grandis TaxID=71139 RepID=UPI00192EDD2B|nr:F-box/LRR-repeat protein At5g02910-like [Eucalyptus grandis]
MAETSNSWGILRSSGDRLAPLPPETFKRRKSSGDRPDRTKGGDLISALPEEAIHRILSFLPVEDAVRTSVLSKRWRFTWTTTTSLVFNRVRPRHHRARSLAFRCIVDSLSQHTSTSALKEFHVNGFCYGEADSPKLEEWLFAEQRLHAISAWS